MNNLGEKIKTLRKKMDITQEELAERLGVSYQAVSKWETNSSYPDITMLPILANLFNITTDELLGVDISKKQERIDEILQEMQRLNNSGKVKEYFDFVSSAYKEYPNNIRIMDKYIWQLVYDPNCINIEKNEFEGPKVHKDQLIKLGNRILNECHDDENIRCSALCMLSTVYDSNGNREKALEYIQRLPSIFNSKEWELSYFYEKGTTDWWEHKRAFICEISEELFISIRDCALWANVTPNERLKLLNKASALLELIYDDEDYGFCYYHFSELSLSIAKKYIELKNYKEAETYIRKGLSYAIKYDELPPQTTHTSFLIKGYVFDKSKISSGSPENEVYRTLKCLEEENAFKNVRNMDWFENILVDYRLYALTNKNY